MDYPEDRRGAAKVAVKALELMERHRITPNPSAYAVWYTYSSERHPELVDQVNVLVADGRPIDDASTLALFEQFLGGSEAERDQLKKTSQKIEEALTQVMAFVESANQGTTRYGEALEDFSGQIENASAFDDLKSVVASVMAETKTMLEFNQQLEEQLNHSSREILELRSNLATVKKEATTDALTGIPNRKVFDATMRQATKTAAEQGQFLTLLMTDIDHFKKFNDTYGHQIGDQVLRLVAKTIQANIRDGDTVARYGGEEFAVILPDTPMRKAMELADKIRIAVAGKRLVNRSKGLDLGKVTLSLGVGEYSLGEKVDTLIQRADAALYTAKKTGRNRVCDQNHVELDRTA